MQRSSYLGPERRKSTAAERQTYARENGLDPRSALLSWFAALPRPVLVALALAGCGYWAREAWAWQGEVNAHIAASVEGYRRLSAVEAGQQRIYEELREMRQEQREKHRDDLLFYRRLAEKDKDRDATHELDRRLLELGERQP